MSLKRTASCALTPDPDTPLTGDGDSTSNQAFVLRIVSTDMDDGDALKFEAYKVSTLPPDVRDSVRTTFARESIIRIYDNYVTDPDSDNCTPLEAYFADTQKSLDQRKPVKMSSLPPGGGHVVGVIFYITNIEA